MIVADVFSAHLITESGYQDITSGIINVDIKFGTDIYEGPQQQIDTGLFTIVSRGSILDPKINSNVVEGASIEFRDSRNVEAGKTNIFFQGYITDIDVQYQREDDSIITITGTDLFGLLQRTVVSEDLRSFALNYAEGTEGTVDENGPNLSTLVNSEPWFQNSPVEINVIDVLMNPAVPGSIEPALPYDNYLGYSPARYLPDLGETLLEVLNKYTQTNLNYCSINFRETPEIIDVYPYAKYNPYFWPPVQDPQTEFTTFNFSSDPADGRPYESILINNGYNRTTKSLAISNETRTIGGTAPDRTIESNTTNYPPFKVNENDTSVATSLNTIFATEFVNNDSIDLYATDIFQAVNFGGDEIQQITFNNARFEDVQNDYTYSFSQLNQFIRIKHQLNNNQTIDRFYDIAGVSHNITPDKWEMGFTFKPAQNEIAYYYQPQSPIVQMNALSGDSNFNFTATISGFPTQDIDEVIWCLNGTNTNVNEQWTFTVDGSRYKDGLQRNGLTQTWNFDDDGILEGPNFPTGGYGTGQWHVIPYIIMKNGWVITTSVMLTVGTPAVEARFDWSQNLTNNFGQVTFTDDSRNNEIGEVDSYFWTFGDGNSSNAQNPIHRYDPAPTQQTYSVSLTVFAYGSGGVKVPNTRTKTIYLEQPEMTANFTWTANGETVTFTNTSVNVGWEEPDAYLWNFGDGTTSTLKNPVKIFPVTSGSVPTNFSVQLRTRNIWEQESFVTKTVPVTALNDIGNYPVKYIKLSTDVISRNVTPDYGYALTPQISSFQGRTSNTIANLLNNAPLIGPGNVIDNISPSYKPQFEWVSVIGDSPLAVYGLPQYLTRTQNTSEYSRGCGSYVRNPGHDLIPTPGAPTNVRMELVVQVPESGWYKISEVAMKAMTLVKNWPDYEDIGSHPESFYPRINVDVATTVSDFTFNPAGTYGPPSLNGDWVNIGYFKFPSGSLTAQFRSMIKQRPLPMNIPYFLYTFNDKTVSFTSVETKPLAGSYLWTFGDGTTSTEKNPVKTYASYGTYTVNLTIRTGSGSIVRSTTEPVKVLTEQISPVTIAVN